MTFSCVDRLLPACCIATEINCLHGAGHSLKCKSVYRPHSRASRTMEALTRRGCFREAIALEPGRLCREKSGG